MGIRLRSRLLGLALCVAGTVAWAQSSLPSARVIVVSSDPSPAYAQAAEALTDSLAQHGIARADIAQSFASELALRLQSDQSPRPSIFVALGSEATQVLVAGNVQTPVLSALLPRRSFERILHGSGKAISARLSAIQLDQPLARQLSLIRLALPHARHLGVLAGPESSAKAFELRFLLASSYLKLQEGVVTQADDLSSALPRVLDDSDVLLALADPLVFNSSTIQNILLASFRAHIPMVAFSAAYVRAGALLAVYTTPEQVGTQAAEVALSVLRGNPLPDHVIEPNDFEVGVNTYVARALGLSPDASSLRMALRRLEHLP